MYTGFQTAVVLRRLRRAASFFGFESREREREQPIGGAVCVRGCAARRWVSPLHLRLDIRSAARWDGQHHPPGSISCVRPSSKEGRPRQFGV